MPTTKSKSKSNKRQWKLGRIYSYTYSRLFDSNPIYGPFVDDEILTCVQKDAERYEIPIEDMRLRWYDASCPEEDNVAACLGDIDTRAADYTNGGAVEETQEGEGEGDNDEGGEMMEVDNDVPDRFVVICGVVDLPVKRLSDEGRALLEAQGADLRGPKVLVGIEARYWRFMFREAWNDGLSVRSRSHPPHLTIRRFKVISMDQVTFKDSLSALEFAEVTRALRIINKDHGPELRQKDVDWFVRELSANSFLGLRSQSKMEALFARHLEGIIQWISSARAMSLNLPRPDDFSDWKEETGSYASRQERFDDEEYTRWRNILPCIQAWLNEEGWVEVIRYLKTSPERRGPSSLVPMPPRSRRSTSGSVANKGPPISASERESRNLSSTSNSSSSSSTSRSQPNRRATSPKRASAGSSSRVIHIEESDSEHEVDRELMRPLLSSPEPMHLDQSMTAVMSHNPAQSSSTGSARKPGARSAADEARIFSKEYQEECWKQFPRVLREKWRKELPSMNTTVWWICPHHPLRPENDPPLCGFQVIWHPFRFIERFRDLVPVEIAKLVDGIFTDPMTFSRRGGEDQFRAKHGYTLRDAAFWNIIQKHTYWHYWHYGIGVKVSKPWVKTNKEDVLIKLVDASEEELATMRLLLDKKATLVKFDTGEEKAIADYLEPWFTNLEIPTTRPAMKRRPRRE